MYFTIIHFRTIKPSCKHMSLLLPVLLARVRELTFKVMSLYCEINFFKDLWCAYNRQDLNVYGRTRRKNA